jgi:hypothetical protein
MNKKGFLTGLIVLAMIAFAIIIILNSNSNIQNEDNIDEILRIKSKLINYKLTLNQASQNCFDLTNPSECIKTNSDLIINELKMDQLPFNCGVSNFSEDEIGLYSSIINCSYVLYSKNNLIFSTSFRDSVIVRDV